MSEFLAPLNYGRARDVLRRLSRYSAYTPQGAAQALDVLRESYPLVFDKLESKQFDNGAVLMEMPGASSTAPLVFVSHLDAAGTEAVAADSPHEMPISVPLSRAHVVALLEALEGLLGEGYQPGGDLLLALSMDGLSGGAGARSIAAHLKARSLSPCFVLDHGGYATMEAFRTYLPKNAPLALIGICEKGEIQGEMTADREVSSRPGRERARPVDELLPRGRASHAPSAPGTAVRGQRNDAFGAGQKGAAFAAVAGAPSARYVPADAGFMAEAVGVSSVLCERAHGMRPERRRVRSKPRRGRRPSSSARR